MRRKRGHYLGTEVDEVWYRRDRRRGYFARGNGEYWVSGGTLYFRRFLTRRPLTIPLRQVTEIKLGSWHAGRWALHPSVIKLLWEREGARLSSGFVLTRTAVEARLRAEALMRLAAKART